MSLALAARRGRRALAPALLLLVLPSSAVAAGSLSATATGAAANLVGRAAPATAERSAWDTAAVRGSALAPAESPAPAATPAPDGTPAPTATPAPEATPAPTATPTPEATPAPTATPTPDATPDPVATPAVSARDVRPASDPSRTPADPPAAPEGHVEVLGATAAHAGASAHAGACTPEGTRRLTVRGRRLRQVTFRLDGHAARTVAARRQRSATTTVAASTRTVTARVRFSDGRAATTLTVELTRCAG